MTTTVDVNEAQQQLPQLLELAAAGNEVIISRDNTPVAQLTALMPAAPPKPRVAGLHAGMTWVSDDFDEPLPDEFWLGES